MNRRLKQASEISSFPKIKLLSSFSLGLHERYICLTFTYAPLCLKFSWGKKAVFLTLGTLHYHWSCMNILHCECADMWLPQGKGWVVIRRRNVILVQQLFCDFGDRLNCSSPIIDLQNYVHPSVKCPQPHHQGTP